MCGLLIWAADVASRLKRATRPGFSVKAADMNFTATWVRRVRWSATHTLPMPPLPRSRTRRTLAETIRPASRPMIDEYHIRSQRLSKGKGGLERAATLAGLETAP